MKGSNCAFLVSYALCVLSNAVYREIWSSATRHRTSCKIYVGPVVPVPNVMMDQKHSEEGLPNVHECKICLSPPFPSCLNAPNWSSLTIIFVKI